jgi:flagellar hook-basal body complex protein FliE
MDISSVNRFLSNKEVSGHTFVLKRTDPRHFAGRGEELPASGGFASVLMDKLNTVNAIQQESLELSRQMLTDPDSVDAHDVMKSLADANMSLNITKAVVDRVIRAYRDITGAR